MTLKILFSLLSGFILLLISWVYLNTDYTLPIEEALCKQIAGWKRKLSPDTPRKTEQLLFINTGKDLALVDDTALNYGQIVVSDREKLHRLLVSIRTAKIPPLLTVLDLQLYYPYSIAPRYDSLLVEDIRNIPNLVLPILKDGSGNYIPPLYPGTYAYLDYRTFGSSLDKFSILKNFRFPSLPVCIQTIVNKTHYQDHGLYYSCNGVPCLSAIWPTYYLSDSQVQNQTTGYAAYNNLGELLLSIDSEPGRKDTIFGNMVVLIGNFEDDRHETPVSVMCGTVALANIYLSLLNDRQIVHPGWLLMLFTGLSILSYFAWFSEMPKIKLRFRVVFTREISDFIQHYISYFGGLFILSLLSVFFFNMQIALLLPSLILNTIEYVRKKRYLPDPVAEPKAPPAVAPGTSIRRTV